MDNFTETIKNIIKLFKSKLITKADLNTDNIFKENITINKNLLVKNGENDNFINILDLIKNTESKTHNHKNMGNLNLVSDTVVDGSKNLTYNNELYQKKFPHNIDSEILSKFSYNENTLYYDGIKIIDPDSMPQKSYNKNEKITDHGLVEINFRNIINENTIKTITNSEIIITNTQDSEDLSMKISNKNITGISEVLIPPSKTHIYSVGINKDNIIRIEGKFEYSITINYF